MQTDQPPAQPSSLRASSGGEAAERDPSTRSYASTEALLVESNAENRSCWASCALM